MTDSVGVYISVPFCRAKCTYCNFASGVFGAERMDAYVDRVCAEIRGAKERAAAVNVELPTLVDTVYLGGGTPSLLDRQQVRRLFDALSGEFDVASTAEVTLECAPGQLGDATLEELLRAGMNRVSFGVQSFVDREAKAVGRLHTRAVCEEEIARMRVAGVESINVDLIAGLPHQTADSWRESVTVAVGSGVPHVSVYMLEVDEDSRLGREVLEHGQRYSAGAVASEDEIADWYAAGCEWLDAAGIRQYEISNFAREGWESKHNAKYWRREPYLGFGLDAHSMLRCGAGGVRWANGDKLEEYLEFEARGAKAEGGHSAVLPLLKPQGLVERVGPEQALEEAIFLGMRMNEGVDVTLLRAQFGRGMAHAVVESLEDAVEAGLAEWSGTRMRLTSRGRMASNEVFGRVLAGRAG